MGAFKYVQTLGVLTLRDQSQMRTLSDQAPITDRDIKLINRENYF